MRVPMRVPQRVQVRVLQLVPVRVPVWLSGAVSPGCPEPRQVPIRVPIRVPELGLVPYRSKSRSGQSQHSGCPESGQVPEWGKSRLPDCPDTGQVPAPRLSKFRYEFRQAGRQSEWWSIFFFGNFSKCWKEGRKEEGVRWFTRDMRGKKKGNKSLGR